MTRVAIKVEGLSKQYRIGSRQQYNALRDQLADALHAPLRKVVRLFRPSSSVAENTRTTFLALKDVSFEVRQGEVLGIIGRNGAGKSTLLKVLSRITEPTRGAVDLYGRVGSLLEVGTGFSAELTGRENIFLNGAIIGMKRQEIRQRFDEIVDFAEVEQFLDTPVKHYSSGMYMRLAFSVAAHLRPEILLVDEVLAVGDAAFQEKCLGKMQAIGQGGRTVVFVSHSMPAIERLCTRCLVLADGSTRWDGAVDGAIQTYLGEAKAEVYQAQANPTRPSITLATVQQLAGPELLLRVEFRSPRPLKPPVLGFVIYDAFARPVFGTNARREPTARFHGAMDAGTVSVRLPAAALRPGRYYISLWLGDQYQDYSHVDRAISLDLRTVNGSEALPPLQMMGSVYLSTDWMYSTRQEEWPAETTIAASDGLLVADAAQR